MFSKAQVGFEHPAKGPHHCSECKHFRGPNSCEIVSGRIEAGDWCEKFMPYDEVMSKYKSGSLHSGSKKGPVVGNRKQAIAIMLSEKRKAQEGNTEYQPKKRGFKI